MRIVTLILILSTTLCSGQVFSQIAFFKLFSNNGYDFGQGVVQDSDSTYMVCGGSSSFTEGPSDAFLLKLDSMGTYLWSSHYGGAETDFARRVLYKSGVGYYLAGFTNSIGAGAYDYYLVKTDEAGTMLWEKSYGGTEWEKVNDAALTKDTGVIMVGESNSTPGGDDDIYIVRTNAEGDTLWTKFIGGTGEDRAHVIEPLNDSTFIVAGTMYNTDSSMYKGFVMRIKDSGVIEWFLPTGNNGNAGINDISLVLDRVNFVGWSLSADYDEYFGRIKTNGTYDFEYALTSPFDKIADQLTDYGSNMKQYAAFRYKDASTFPGGYDIALVREGENMWYDNSLFKVGYTGEDMTGELISTSDGGAIFTGYVSSFGAGGNSVFVCKIGPNDLYPTVPIGPGYNPLVSVEEYEVSNGVKLYPNPTNGDVNIDLPMESQYSIQVVDALGKQVLTGSFTQSIHLDLSQMESGVYLYFIRENGVELLSAGRIIRH
jgi:hypothetical protein